jgi:hypothetical protein
VGEIEEMLRKLKQLRAKSDESVRRLQEVREKRVTTIKVDKRTQRIRFEGETEDQVTVIIEPKAG